MSPTISVAIPTYEMKGAGPQYLFHLLENIRNQKFKNFEVCISDHCKDDMVLEVVQKFSNKFKIKPRQQKTKSIFIKVFRNSPIKYLFIIKLFIYFFRFSL